MDHPRLIVSRDDRAGAERVRRRPASERIAQREDARAIAKQDLEADLGDKLADPVHRVARLDGGSPRGLHLRVARPRPRRLEHRVADEGDDLGLVQEHTRGAVPAGQLGGGEQLEALLLPGQHAHRGIVATAAAREGLVAPGRRSAAPGPGDQQREHTAHDHEAFRGDEQQAGNRMHHAQIVPLGSGTG